MKAIELGEPKAKFELYNLMIEDDPKAVELLQKAADMGHEKAVEKLRGSDKESGQ